MRGIDISNYQTGLNFSALKASGIDIVYIKATEGLTWNNPQLLTQYKAVLAQGLRVGFYHFIRTNDPVAEAKHFLSKTNRLHADCKYAIDAENRNEAVGLSARIRKFADYLISQGKEVCLYTYLNFYQTEILPIVRDLPFWMADYCSTRPSIKSVGWQYSNSNGKLDLDIFDDGILLSGVKASMASTIKATVTKATKVFTGRGIVQTLQQEVNKQYGKHLDDDGWVGNLTLDALPVVHQGASGNITKIIQTFLAIPTNGIFNDFMLGKVKYFQTYNHLKADGVVGINTWKLLLK